MCYSQAAQEYCGPQQSALEIQAWMDQADALFSNAMPSVCWDVLFHSAYEDQSEIAADTASTAAKRLQNALGTLHWELELRLGACQAWFTMYAGDQHADELQQLNGVYKAAQDQAHVLVLDMIDKTDAMVGESKNQIQEHLDMLLNRRSEIDAAEAAAIETVSTAIAQVS